MGAFRSRSLSVRRVNRNARKGRGRLALAASAEVTLSIDEPSFCEIEDVAVLAAPAACMADMVDQ